MTKKPLILIPCNVIDYNGSPGHVARQTYIDAVLDIAGGIPLLLPSSGNKIRFEDLAGKIDGVMLTGSPSHVAPACYGEKQVFDDKELDPARDSTTLPLIRQVVERDLPLLAICRGFQELNVVMGGTLHQRVHELPGKNDHRTPAGISAQGIMAVYHHRAHNVTVQKGGLLEKWGVPGTFSVNTVHQQGIDRLGNGLTVDAMSDDGLIEAISIPSKRYVFGTQWHPEGETDISLASETIFRKFGDALRGV